MYAPGILPVYPARSLSRSQFLHLWAAGSPIVITGAQKNFQGHWDPTYFIGHHGKLWVTPIDCETNQERPRMAASNFFALLLGKSGPQPVLKLKVGPSVMLAQSLMTCFDVGLAAKDRLPDDLRETQPRVLLKCTSRVRRFSLQEWDIQSRCPLS